MTARAVTGDRDECLAAGMDDYVSKPVRQEDLARAIDHVVPGGIETYDVAAPPLVADAATLPLENDSELFDATALLDRVAGDRNLLAELVSLFLESSSLLLDECAMRLPLETPISCPGSPQAARLGGSFRGARGHCRHGRNRNLPLAGDLLLALALGSSGAAD